MLTPGRPVDLLLIRVLHPGSFPQDRTCDWANDGPLETATNRSAPMACGPWSSPWGNPRLPTGYEAGRGRWVWAEHLAVRDLLDRGQLDDGASITALLYLLAFAPIGTAIKPGETVPEAGAT